MLRDKTAVSTVLGMDNRSEEADLVSGTVRAIENFYVDNRGALVPRAVPTLVAQHSESYHSLFAVSTGTVLCMRGTTLCHLINGVPTTVGTVEYGDEGVTYAEQNNRVFLGAGSNLYVYHEGLLSPVGVRRPDFCELVPSSDEPHLPKGVYAIAATAVVGDEESPPVYLGEYEADGAHSLRVSAPTPIRVYSTAVNGAQYMQQPDNQVLGADGAPMLTEEYELQPAGEALGFYKSRLVSACSGYLIFGEPFVAGYFRPSEGIIPVEGEIRMLACLDDAVFYADASGTWVLRGNELDSLSRERVAAPRALFCKSTYMRATEFASKQVPAEAGTVAVWLTDSGYVVGMSTGNVVLLQDQRIRLPESSAGCVGVVTTGTHTSVISGMN